MPKREEFSGNKLVLAVFLFGLFYFVLYALSSASEAIRANPSLKIIDELAVFSLPSLGLEDIGKCLAWTEACRFSPMYLLLPAAAFFIIFFLVGWANDYFETKQALHPLFPVLFFAMSLAAFYIALFWYYSNFSQLAGTEVPFDFAAQLKQSAFLLFIWGGVFGWITRYAVEKIKL